MLKQCTECELEKPREEFSKRQWANPSITRCKSCSRKKERREILSLKDKEGNITHRECATCFQVLPLENFYKNKTKSLLCEASCKDCEKERKLLTRYNMSYKTKELMYFQQKNSCKICMQLFEMNKLCIDHCHKTGVVRGLLCSNCNVAIGMIRDDPKICLNMFEYLSKNNKDATERINTERTRNR